MNKIIRRLSRAAVMLLIQNIITDRRPAALLAMRTVPAIPEAIQEAAIQEVIREAAIRAAIPG